MVRCIMVGCENCSKYIAYGICSDKDVGGEVNPLLNHADCPKWSNCSKWYDKFRYKNPKNAPILDIYY